MIRFRAFSSQKGSFDPSTVLLLPMTGADQSTNFLDISRGGIDSPRGVTANGDAKIITSLVDPFGVSGGVGEFDGDDYLTTADTDDADFGSDPFTIEAWVYVDAFSVNDDAYIYSTGTQGLTNLGRLCILYFGGSNWYLAFRADAGGVDDSVQLVYTTTFPTSQWVHVAVSRIGSTWRLFFNGTLVDTDTNANGYPSSDTGMYIGASSSSPAAANSIDGKISNLRVSYDIARYTANFTPPTEPFSP